MNNNDIIRQIKLSDNKKEVSNLTNNLISNNQGLVISVVDKLSMYSNHRDDMIQEGNISMLTAIDRFDIDKGYSFSTYALYWIKKGVLDYVNNNIRTIRLPQHMVNKLVKINKNKDRFVNMYGKEPTAEQLSDFMEFDIVELRNILSNEYPIASKDDNDVDITLISDDSSTLEDDRLSDSEIKKLVSNELLDMSEVEREVLLFTCDMNSKYRTADHLCDDYNISVREMRHIKQKGLSKLRKGLSDWK